MIVLTFLLSFLVVHAEDCTSRWERFSSEPYEQWAFPDTHANYWRFRFQRNSHDRIALKVSGHFASARYMNFNIYDQDTLDSSGSLPDIKIKREKNAQTYTVWVTPYGEKTSLSNEFQMPAVTGENDTQAIELWYRLYVPEKDEAGGVELPRIEAFDLSTKKRVDCPLERKRWIPPLWKALGNLPPRDTREIKFYASRGRALYANLDNGYVASFLNFWKGAVALVRVRAPRVPGDVRYWSVCLGGITTQTSYCLPDYQATVASDGFVNVVVGPDEMRNTVEEKGLNFIPRGKLWFPILIYRNLLTRQEYAGNISHVPTYPPQSSGLRKSDLQAEKFIGDFAPKGVHCRLSEFTADLNEHPTSVCGVPLSYPADKNRNIAGH